MKVLYNLIVSKCVNKPPPGDGITPTMLVCKNRQSEVFNIIRLNRLGDLLVHEYRFKCGKRFGRPDWWTRKCVPDKLPLKVNTHTHTPHAQ